MFSDFAFYIVKKQMACFKRIYYLNINNIPRVKPKLLILAILGSYSYILS